MIYLRQSLQDIRRMRCPKCDSPVTPKRAVRTKQPIVLCMCCKFAWNGGNFSEIGYMATERRDCPHKVELPNMRLAYADN